MAIIFVVQKLHHLVHHNKFIELINHQGLEYSFWKLKPIERIAKWIYLFQEDEFTIKGQMKKRLKC
jgi:hypothetical protein